MFCFLYIWMYFFLNIVRLFLFGSQILWILIQLILLISFLPQFLCLLLPTAVLNYLSLVHLVLLWLFTCGTLQNLADGSSCRRGNLGKDPVISPAVGQNVAGGSFQWIWVCVGCFFSWPKELPVVALRIVLSLSSQSPRNVPS